MSRDADTRPDAVVDLTDASTRAEPRARVRPPEPPPSPARPTLDDLVHPHDAERLVGLIQQASRRRQDTFVRVRNADVGWIEVRCSFVPVEATEPSDR